MQQLKVKRERRTKRQGRILQNAHNMKDEDGKPIYEREKRIAERERRDTEQKRIAAEIKHLNEQRKKEREKTEKEELKRVAGLAKN